MRFNQHRQGFTILEVILVIVIVVLIAGTGYYVWRSQSAASKNYKDLGSSVTNQAPNKKAPTMEFEDCQKLPGSKILETYPEQCVTKDGQRFTQTSNYLIIKEWGIKIKLGDPSINDAYYLLKSNLPDVAYLSLNSFKGTDCSAEGVTEGAIVRYTASDKGDDGAGATSLTSIYGTEHKVGDYYYAYVHQQAGCSDDTVTQAKASVASDAFKAAVATIQAAD